MGKQLGHHAGGLLDSAYDLHSNMYMDPADEVVIHHIRAMYKLVQALPSMASGPASIPGTSMGQHTPTTDDQNPSLVYCQRAHGRHHRLPAGMELAGPRSEAQDLFRWNNISLQDPGWKIEQTLLQEARQQRARVQCAVQHREHSKPKPCPICHVPATPKHIIWMCKWRREQQHEAMPPEWMDRINCPEEEPLWSAGWIPLKPQDHKRQDRPYQGHGAWQTLQPLAPRQQQGWAFMLDATPSTYDTRSQLWVFGLCVHTMSLGQLRRLGAISGVAPGPQNKARALFAGLVALAQRTTTPVKVTVQLTTVWQAWNNPHHRQPYLDLLAESRTRTRSE